MLDEKKLLKRAKAGFFPCRGATFSTRIHCGRTAFKGGKVARLQRKKQWSTEEIEKAIAVRLKRQQVLTNTDKTFQLVLDERVLEPSVCDRRVMREQLKALAAASRNPNIDLRVLPMGVKIDACPVTSFAVFDNSLVSVETLTHEMTIWTAPDIERYVAAFSVIREASLSVEETRKRLSLN